MLVWTQTPPSLGLPKPRRQGGQLEDTPWSIQEHSHFMGFSRDHKAPASVGSQSHKHSMGVGELRDTGKVVVLVGEYWGNRSWAVQVAHPSGTTSFPPLLSGPGEQVGGQLHPAGASTPSLWDPSPSPGQDPWGRLGLSRSPCPQGECCPFCAL